MKKEGKKRQFSFRIGAYGISQVPLNIMVGEVGINAVGEEYFISGTMSYWKNYDSAIMDVYNRLLADHAHQSTLNSVKGLIESIKLAKEEILEVLNK